MATINDLNQDLVDKLTFEEYVDLFCEMLKTLGNRRLYFAED